MAKDREEELRRLEKHLLAEDVRQEVTAKAYNPDRTDVDLETYSEAVRGEKKSGCIWFVILLIAAMLGLFLYFVWGGQLPWK